MVADRIGFSDDLFRPLGKDVDRLFGSAADWVGDGKSLSDRLWLAGKMDRRAIDGILRHGLATGADPLKVARDLEDYLLPAGRPVRNPETGRIVKWKRDETGKLLRDTRGRLIPVNAKGVTTRTPRSGMGSYAARRLARTEVSRAFNQGVIQAAALNPFVEGVKWNKSASHNEEDICDEHAQGHSAGMAPGEYRLDEFPQMPAHPQCLCYVTTVVTQDSDAVIAQLRREFDLGEPLDVRIVESPAWVQDVQAIRRELADASFIGPEHEERLRAAGKILREQIERAPAADNQAEIDALRTAVAEAQRAYQRAPIGVDRTALYDARRAAEKRLREAEKRRITPDPLAVLKQVRSFGESTRQHTYATGSMNAAKAGVNSVRDTVPTQWWDFSVESGPLKSRVVKRAYYRAGQYTASELHVSGEVSRHANVAVHEFGHRMEHIDGQIRDLETLFYQRRTTGERLAHMGPGYAKDELTRRDQFRHPYIGKDYGGQHYEILSMGMQDLFGEQEFIWDDPDMADFILGILGTI